MKYLLTLLLFVSIFSHAEKVLYCQTELGTGDIAFQALFDKKGHKLIQEVLNNGGGMMGPAGAAAIVLGDIVFNEDHPTGFMFVSGHLLEMCDEILNS